MFASLTPVAYIRKSVHILDIGMLGVSAIFRKRKKIYVGTIVRNETTQIRDGGSRCMTWSKPLLSCVFALNVECSDALWILETKQGEGGIKYGRF